MEEKEGRTQQQEGERYKIRYNREVATGKERREERKEKKGRERESRWGEWDRKEE